MVGGDILMMIYSAKDLSSIEELRRDTPWRLLWTNKKIQQIPAIVLALHDSDAFDPEAIEEGKALAGALNAPHHETGKEELPDMNFIFEEVIRTLRESARRNAYKATDGYKPRSYWVSNAEVSFAGSQVIRQSRDMQGVVVEGPW
jgi:hypothetical protein